MNNLGEGKLMSKIVLLSIFIMNSIYSSIAQPSIAAPSIAAKTDNKSDKEKVANAKAFFNDKGKLSALTIQFISGRFAGKGFAADAIGNMWTNYSEPNPNSKSKKKCGLNPIITKYIEIGPSLIAALKQHKPVQNTQSCCFTSGQNPTELDLDIFADSSNVLIDTRVSACRDFEAFFSQNAPFAVNRRS